MADAGASVDIRNHEEQTDTSLLRMGRSRKPMINIGGNGRVEVGSEKNSTPRSDMPQSSTRLVVQPSIGTYHKEDRRPRTATPDRRKLKLPKLPLRRMKYVSKMKVRL